VRRRKLRGLKGIEAKKTVAFNEDEGEEFVLSSASGI
jgi:hypothetical protein